MSKTKQVFDVRAAIAAAWDFEWATRIASRKKYEKEAKTNPKMDLRYYTAGTYYIAATDIERRVRTFAWEQAQGQKWGTETGDMSYYSGIRISLGRGRTLFDECREWLLRNPKLTHHNFGKGHISGARFRPVGEPVGPVEAETLAKKAKDRANPRPKPRHYGRDYGSRALCVIESAKAANRSCFMSRSTAWTTNDPKAVTCPRCLKLLAADPERVSRDAAERAKREESNRV